MRAVAAAILAAVEDGILPPGMALLNAELMRRPHDDPPGKMLPMHRDRRDARRYAKHIPANVGCNLFPDWCFALILLAGKRRAT